MYSTWCLFIFMHSRGNLFTCLCLFLSGTLVQSFTQCVHSRVSRFFYTSTCTLYTNIQIWIFSIYFKLLVWHRVFFILKNDDVILGNEIDVYVDFCIYMFMHGHTVHCTWSYLKPTCMLLCRTDRRLAEMWMTASKLEKM